MLNGQRTVLTSQFFLPDALSEFLYTSLPDYRRTQVRETLNRNDGIALVAGSTVLGTVREEADRYVATLNVVVDPLATAVTAGMPMPGEGAPPEGERRGPPPGGANGPPPGGGPGRGKALSPAERLSALVPGKPKN
ncbi:peptidase associated/transthyretin-like domain-containing protein [Polaromonas naphthalenivorans]|uniref:hypothetical protein n=1 Tax=Polaromonas naphthalenivorans TaxID=216465 RepID=UPI0002D30663|nr:hypothetical protein [Polaromonas naphthalenivorans]